MAKQTTLKISQEGHWILETIEADPPPVLQPLSKASEGPSYIWKIPDEVLDIVFSYAVPLIRYSYRHELAANSYAATLIRVCKRFYRVAIPWLYRDIHISSPNSLVPATDAILQLHQVLTPALRTYRVLNIEGQLDPVLTCNLPSQTISSSHQSPGRHCHRLGLHVPDISLNGPGSSADWTRAEQMIDVMPNVRWLSLHGGFEKNPSKMWALLARAAKRMPHLEELTLSRECWNLGLGDLYDLPAMPRLKALRIHGASPARGTIGIPTPRDEQIRKAPFTSLTLDDFTDSYQALRNLLTWPEHLEYFSYSDTDSGTLQISLTDLETMLCPHKHTLRSIKIESLMVREKTCPNFTEFSTLENLTLPALDMECTPEEAAAKLLAPRLTKFTWSFVLNSQMQLDISVLSPDRLEWLRQFIELAVERKAGLKEVFIDCPLDEEEEWPETPRKNLKIWDGLEDLEADAAARGLKLSYNRPVVIKVAAD